VPRKDFDLSSLRAMFSTGSPLAPESFDYVYQTVRDDLCLSSISGGTDIVSCFALGNPTLPVWRGELQCRGLGLDVDVFDENARPVREEKGELGDFVKANFAEELGQRAAQVSAAIGRGSSNQRMTMPLIAHDDNEDTDDDAFPSVETDIDAPPLTTIPLISPPADKTEAYGANVVSARPGERSCNSIAGIRRSGLSEPKRRITSAKLSRGNGVCNATPMMRKTRVNNPSTSA